VANKNVGLLIHAYTELSHNGLRAHTIGNTHTSTEGGGHRRLSSCCLMSRGSSTDYVSMSSVPKSGTYDKSMTVFSVSKKRLIAPISGTHDNLL
jgi:hypothetical protein